MKASDILDKLLEHSNLNSKQFSEKIGLERPQAVYDIQKGKTKTISSAMKCKILSVFPEINEAWLLTGKGDMFIADNGYSEASVTNLEEKDTTLLIVQMMNDRLIAPFSLIEDRDREIARLNKEIAKLSRETGRLEAQLEHSKKGFVPKGGNAICAAAE